MAATTSTEAGRRAPARHRALAALCGLALSALAAGPAAGSPRTKAAEVVKGVERDLKALRVPRPDRVKELADDLTDLGKALDQLVKTGAGQLADVGVAAEKKTTKAGVDVAGPRGKAIAAAKDLAKAVGALRKHVKDQAALPVARREARLDDTWKKKLTELTGKAATLGKAMTTLDKAVVEAGKKAATLHERGTRPADETRKLLVAARREADTLDQRQLVVVADWVTKTAAFRRLVTDDAEVRTLIEKDTELDKLEAELATIQTDLTEIETRRAGLRTRLQRDLAAIDALADGVVLWAAE